jgi:hypothetical protein
LGQNRNIRRDQFFLSSSIADIAWRILLAWLGVTPERGVLGIEMPAAHAGASADAQSGNDRP